MEEHTNKRNRRNFDFTESSKFKLTLAISSSIYAIFLLIVFQPFGINNYQHESYITFPWLLNIISIGLVAFTTFCFNEFLIRSLVVKRNTLLSISIWFSWEFVLVGSVLFLYYNYLGGFHDLLLQSFLSFILNSTLVLVFPFFATLFYFNHKILKTHYQEILSLSKKNDGIDNLLLISGDYQKDEIALPPANIVFIKSVDNYVSVHFIEDNTLKKHLIRSTLQNIEGIINQPFIVRCNRSVIVNLNKIESVKKQGKKPLLKLQYVSDVISVSTRYQATVDDFLEKKFKSKEFSRP